MQNNFEDLKTFINSLSIMDTHEHLQVNEKDREKNTDFLCEYLMAYAITDLRSSGLSEADIVRITTHHLPLKDRWAMVEPYWEHSRNTGYMQCLDRSVRGLYGVPCINAKTMPTIEAGFRESLNKTWYPYVLCEKSNIKISLVDSNLDCDKSMFRSVIRMDDFVIIRKYEDIYKVEQEQNTIICRLDDWLYACERAMDSALKRGAVALKIGLAYFRSLSVSRPTKAQAEEEFNKLFSSKRAPLWLESAVQPAKCFEDYMIHQILFLANQRNLVVQVHTGIQEGSGNTLSFSEPSQMCNLFLEYPKVKFVLFHMSYPYSQVAGALAKMFPNVFLDMCWSHIISPTACVTTLDEWLDVVPANKINAFGGDFGFIDGVYGHQEMARENVARTLALKVDRGDFNLSEAKEIAMRLFITNAQTLYKMETI